MTEQIQGWKKEMMKKNYKKKVVVPKYIKRIDKSVIGKKQVKKFYKNYIQSKPKKAKPIIKTLATDSKKRKGFIKSVGGAKYIDISKYTTVKVQQQQANQPNFYGTEDIYGQNKPVKKINPKQPFQSGGLRDAEMSVP